MNGSITVGGRTHSLHFTVNHICRMEEALGESLPKLMQGSIYGLRALLWCGLMGEGMEMEETGSLIQSYLQEGGSLNTLSQMLAAAMEDAGFFPSPAAKQEK